MFVVQHYRSAIWEHTLYTRTVGNTNRRQKKNKPAKVLKTAKLTFQDLYRYVLYLISDKAVTARW